MQTTIYIRKDNEDFWDSLADKSAQVNSWITAAKEGPEVGTFKNPIKRDVRSIKTPEAENSIGLVPDDSILVGNVKGHLPEDLNLCSHGAGPRLCKEKKCKNYQFKWNAGNQSVSSFS